MGHIVAIIFRLRIFVIPVSEEARVLFDIKSTVKSSSVLESTLHKKHSSIYYHAVQWEVAVGNMVVEWIEKILNIANEYTKILSDIHG